ncbi:MAG: diacylglycerol/lipid kinase family protein [Limnohabitans sp.]
MTLVLVNPHARGGRIRQLLPALRETLETLTPFPRLLVPDTVDLALDALLREPEGARVVLVGGDGTFNRYLPALLERRLRTGLVPLGSGNDLARGLGLHGLGWRAAVAQALRGPARPMDTGLAVWSDLHGDAHRTPFASSLTCGFDSAVGLRALQGPRWLRGLPRYLWATLGEWRQLRHWTVRGHADTAALPAGPMLFTSVLNTPTFGAGLPAVPHARLDDGQLDWLRAGPFGRWATLGMLPRLMRGSHLGHALVKTGACASLELHCASGLPLAADGEWLGLAQQLRVTVQPGSLQVVCPPPAST